MKVEPMKVQPVKTDFKVLYKNLYAPKAGEFARVEVPVMNFLMIDGHGNPNTAPAYALAVQALYSSAYGLKFFSKKQLGHDYTVPPLEGLWWASNPSAFTLGLKDDWDWTMMIMVPDWLGAEQVQQVLADTKLKKPELPIDALRFESYAEGACVQTMHIGPYANEGPTLERLHLEYMPTQGLTFNGKHHEIYIGDPRRGDQAKLKTVLRQPVRAL